MSVPQTNATVVRVASAGGPVRGGDDWDAALEPPGPGPAPLPGVEKWAGAERVYLQSAVKFTGGADGGGVAHVRAIVARSSWALEAAVDVDDLVTVELDGGQHFTVQPTDVATSVLAGIPDEMQTCRLTLAAE